MNDVEAFQNVIQWTFRHCPIPFGLDGSIFCQIKPSFADVQLESRAHILGQPWAVCRIICLSLIPDLFSYRITFVLDFEV